jgi:NAD+ kinase
VCGVFDVARACAAASAPPPTRIARLGERGQILGAGVVVLMLLVGGLRGEPDREEGQQRRDHVAARLDSGRGKAESPGDHTCDELQPAPALSLRRSTKRCTCLTGRTMSWERSEGNETARPVRRVAVVLRPERDLRDALEEICDWAASAGVALTGSDRDPRLPEDVDRRPEGALAAGCDVVLALGGDGTMLGALRLAAPHGAPVLGINLGTLGYLTEIDAGHLGDALSALGDGGYTVENRNGLSLAAAPRTGVPAEIAYNDVVLSRVPGRGQAALGLSVDGELLVRYASDGVIMATPQGSTAYAFAAGGPLVSPRAQGVIVMPDAPHGLFNRAVVLAEGERLGIEVLASSAPVSVELDGRLLGHAEPGATLDILARPNAARVARVHPGGFAERARRKLGITDPAGLADFDLAGHER